MKKLLITLTALSLLIPNLVFGAPNYNYQHTILPFQTDYSELGTSTLEWYRVFTKYASTTQLTATSLCLTGDTCRTTWPTGSGSTFGQAWEVYGSGTYLAPTTTLPIIVNAATSTITNLVMVNSTSTNATTTNLFATNASTTNATSTNLYSNQLETNTLRADTSSGMLHIASNGTNVSIFGVGNSANTLFYGGVNVNSTLNVLSDLSTLLNLQVNSSSTLQNFTFLNATGTQATTTNFAVSSVGNALYLGNNSSGSLVAYGGTSCTNQFIRSVSATGVATCATVSSSDVSLAALTAGSGLTSAGTYTGATARTFSIDFASINTWTGGQTFALATATSATTTDFNVSSRHATFGSNYAYVNGTTSPAFNLASTTLDAMGKSFNIGTSTFLLRNNPEPIRLIGFYCTASTTGTALVRFSHDNGNATETSTCTSGGFTLTSTNNTWTSYEAFNVQASSTAGTVNRITVTAVIQKTGDQ